MTRRNQTRAVRIGSLNIGDSAPVVLQSMSATKTTDIPATVETIKRLHEAGAGIVRLAVDTRRDALALEEIRKRTEANLSVDLQENYRLAEIVAPFVDKIRYNPGHLHHVAPSRSWREKVRTLADTAEKHDCALRIGVNCGSVDPRMAHRSTATSDEPLSPAVESAWEHAEFLDEIGFTRYCVSIKGSNPKIVLEENRAFARLRPEIPLHLGVTEAGMPPEGVLKSRIALEPLLADGIGDTLRVSLTVPNERKHEEIEAGKTILANVRNKTIATMGLWNPNRLDIVSCPSCARVQNESFVKLAETVRDATQFARNWPLKIAVMGCRVNGPGETDDADLGLWCGTDHVNFKAGETFLGTFSYDEIVPKLLEELRKLGARNGF